VAIKSSELLHLQSKSKLWLRWFAIMPGTPLLVVAILIGLRISGLISDQPLEPTRLAIAIKYGCIVSFAIGFLFVLRDTRRYLSISTLIKLASALSSATSVQQQVQNADGDGRLRLELLQQIKTRSYIILGGLTGNVMMLFGIYVVMRADWLLAAIVIYSITTSWYFHPRMEALADASLSILSKEQSAIEKLSS
jgi:hypothetical protein